MCPGGSRAQTGLEQRTMEWLGMAMAVLQARGEGVMAVGVARRRGLQEGSGVKPASKAETGMHQKHELGWELGSPVLTVGLGVAAAEDEAQRTTRHGR